MSAAAQKPDPSQRAADPHRSAWVSANAGAGKTYTLANRVTRLLLAGARPERILCLTYTKAAAAEMRNRLAGQLGRWAMADGQALDEEIRKLINRAPEPQERIVARRLFARVLDAPGGINILTIHAFCQALLKRFPLEAGVAPGFEVLDEGDAVALLRQAQDEQIEALTRPDAPTTLTDALAAVAGRISIAEYAELMARLLAERAWLQARVGSEAGLQGLRARLTMALRCDNAPFIDELALRKAARALIGASKADAARGEAIMRRLETGDELEDYRAVFFTEKGELRKTLATKAAVKSMPNIEDVLADEAERLECMRGLSLVELTIALLRLGLDITERYAGTKRRRAVLDYDDLIVATRRLLESAESAAWVLYKLDAGIDHVLVDEAQDTSEAQWRILDRLTGDFAAEAARRRGPRTFFAVGDE